MYHNFLSFASVVLVGLFQVKRFMAMNPAEFIIEMDENKDLHGHCLLETISMIGHDVAQCLEHCLGNCLCRAFQICDLTECQLCSSGKYATASTLRTRQGCNHFDLKPRLLESNYQQCADSCSTSINCCLTSNPCLNGGTCLPSNPTIRRSSRFICKCPDGFTGIRCREPIKSCRGYNTGNRISGIYKIFGEDMKLFEVFCDFDQQSPMTWTLIYSYAIGNLKDESALRKLGVPLFENTPVNENNPSWTGYRLSKSRMKSIQQDSREWRFTCGYEKIHDSDFVQGRNFVVDILSELPLEKYNLAKVKHLKIGEQVFDECLASFGQEENEGLHLRVYVADTWLAHLVSGNTTICDVQTPGSSIDGSSRMGVPGTTQCVTYNYFGSYILECLDSRHYCSANHFSTTNMVWTLAKFHTRF